MIAFPSLREPIFCMRALRVLRVFLSLPTMLILIAALPRSQSLNRETITIHERATRQRDTRKATRLSGPGPVLF